MSADRPILISAITAICLVMAPFVSFFARNFNDPALERVFFFEFAAATIVGTLALFALVGFVVSRFARSAVPPTLVSLGIVWYALFFFKPLNGLWDGLFQRFDAPLVTLSLFSILFALAIVAICAFAKRPDVRLPVTIFSGVALVVPLIQLLMLVATWAMSDVEGEGSNLIVEGAKASDRNVYFIVADMYGAPEELKRAADIDVSNFMAEMKAHGFRSADDAMAPYNMTFLTMAAIISGDYIADEKSRPVIHREQFYPRMMMGLRLPAAMKAIRALGYRYFVVGNEYAGCRGPHVECLKFEGVKGLPYSLRVFLSPTPLSIVSRRNYRDVADPITKVDAIGRVTQLLLQGKQPSGRLFMLMHHLSPHPPYLFNPDCTLREDYDPEIRSGRTTADEKALFRDNVACTNRKLINFARVIEKKDPRAIVVVVGDHGTSFSVDWSRPLAQWTKAQNFERSRVLTLARLPEDCRKHLSSRITSVNLMRVVVGCIGGTAPALLRNKSYISKYEFASGERERVRLIADHP